LRNLSDLKDKRVQFKKRPLTETNFETVVEDEREQRSSSRNGIENFSLNPLSFVTHQCKEEVVPEELFDAMMHTQQSILNKISYDEYTIKIDQIEVLVRKDVLQLRESILYLFNLINSDLDVDLDQMVIDCQQQQKEKQMSTGEQNLGHE
jgi:hypothetical protein